MTHRLVDDPRVSAKLPPNLVLGGPSPSWKKWGGELKLKNCHWSWLKDVHVNRVEIGKSDLVSEECNYCSIEGGGNGN